MELSPSLMAPSDSATTVWMECRWRKKKSARVGLWKRRQTEKSKNRLSRLAWKSRKHRGIPTFPQPRLRLDYQPKPDISLATKTGHFNLLPTDIRLGRASREPQQFSIIEGFQSGD